jgi:hypothetical protein
MSQLLLVHPVSNNITGAGRSRCDMMSGVLTRGSVSLGKRMIANDRNALADQSFDGSYKAFIIGRTKRDRHPPAPARPVLPIR